MSQQQQQQQQQVHKQQRSSMHRRHVTFADDVVQRDAEYVLDDDDIESMFYTNADVNCILKECKKDNELPLFWRSLRVHRIELLWEQVEMEQHYQRKEMSAMETRNRNFDLDLRRASLKISKHQQDIAVRDGKKAAEEVKEFMSSTSATDLRREIMAATIHKSLSQRNYSLPPLHPLEEAASLQLSLATLLQRDWHKLNRGSFYVKAVSEHHHLCKQSMWNLGRKNHRIINNNNCYSYKRIH